MAKAQHTFLSAADFSFVQNAPVNPHPYQRINTTLVPYINQQVENKSQECKGEEARNLDERKLFSAMSSGS